MVLFVQSICVLRIKPKTKLKKLQITMKKVLTLILGLFIGIATANARVTR